ncbi:hypothetical protein [Desulforapulum autotrophicum]|nr:hypothetical protein [Desulforapulum autotrophicum]
MDKIMYEIKPGAIQPDQGGWRRVSDALNSEPSRSIALPFSWKKVYIYKI